MKGATIITDKDIPEYKKILKYLKKKILFKDCFQIKDGIIKILEHEYIGEKQYLKIKYKNSVYSFI